MGGYVTVAVRHPVEISRGSRLNPTSSSLPLEFSGQTPPRPAAVSVSLEPGNIRDGMVRLQRNPLVEMPAPPVPFWISFPIGRVDYSFGFTPCPRFITPELPPNIAVLLNEP